MRHTSSPLNMGRRHGALLILLAVYLAVTLLYAQLNPLGEAPDEVAHMDLVRFIGQQGHLPRTPAERQAAGYKSAWPMLYHALVGVATGWVDYQVLPELKVNSASPRRLLIEDGFSPWAVIHTDDERFPYLGVVLAWRLARLASVLISAGTIVLTYIIALTVRPDDHWLALGATGVSAAIPQFHLVASAVNDDNLLGLLAAAFTLGLLRAWQGPQRRWVYAWLGVCLGLALTTKYSVALLPLMAIAVLAGALRRKTLRWRAALGRMLLFATAMAAAAAWWFVYVELYFNQVRELGWVTGLIQPLMSTGGSDPSTQVVASLLTAGNIQLPQLASSPATLWNWATYLFSSFWWVPVEAGPPLVTLVLLIFLGLSGLALSGVVRAWRQADPLPRPVLALLILQIGLLLAFPLLRFYLIRNPAETGQGRHVLLPALSAVGLLLTVGVSAWFPPAWRRFVGLGLASALLIVSLVGLFGFVLPAFPPPMPVRTATNALEDVPHGVNRPLGDGIELAGFQVGVPNPFGALPVTLVWHSLAYAQHDHLVELSLVDRRGRLRTLWVGHPLDGHYPTRAWDPGDVIRDTVWLPVTGLTAGDYGLRLRMLPTSEPAPGQPGTDTVEAFLTNVTLTAVPTPPPAAYVALLSTASRESIGYSAIVWQTGQPATDTPKYRYRATIPINLVRAPSPQPPAPSPIFLVGPDGLPRPPAAQAGDTYIFLVDAFWPSGDYALQVQQPDATIQSDPLLRVQVRQRIFEAPPMSAQVRANFGGEIMLLGYDFPERRAAPGGALPITLYWQALRPMQRHYVVANHLLNSADLRQWGGRDRVPKDYYSTTLWTPGEVVRDDYLIPVQPSAPPGVYRLDIGLYVEAAGQTWHLPLVADSGVLDAASVTISPIKVGGPPPGVTVQMPAPQVPRADNLEGLVTLLGYDLSLEPQTLHLTLYWRDDAPLAADYTTFVHVRDAMGIAGQPGAILAQMDRPPAHGAYPTSLWEPGEVIRDPVEVPLPARVPPGEYEINVGLYDLTSGVRLRVFDQLGQPVGDHIRLEKTVIVR